MSLPIESFEPSVPARQQETPLSSHVDAIFSNRWMILAITLFAFLGALAYVMVTPSVYSADIIVQVEEELPNGQARSLLGDVSSMFDTKAETSGEMEVLRSRMVVGPAVDKFLLYIHAKPRYFPVVGEWLAQRYESLPYPSSLPRGGYAWGGESIAISQLDVPNEWLGKPFRLTTLGEGRYTLSDKLTGATFTGTVGKPERFLLPGGGAMDVHVDALSGRPGTEFTVSRSSRLAAIENVQARMGIFERGRTSGVIGVTLEGNDPALTTAVLNQIGQEYVQQNVNRKSAQAEKSLVFLEQQLPQLKAELDAAETKYNALRNKRGTIDLSEEAKLILGQSVDAQTRVMELRQKRQELITRFAPTHPSIVGIDRQIASLTGDVNRLGNNIRQLPDLEQDVVRLVRDVRVNTELYTALLNNTQQLKLIRAGKVGNVRILDAAVQPDKPVRPKGAIIIGVATAAGLIFAMLCAFVRNALFGGLSEPEDVERHTGLPVLAAIPYSDVQDKLWRRSRRKNATVPALLAQSQGNSPPIESLRSFRNVLQASLRQSANNMVMFTGPVAGVGKSFLSANFAFIQGGVGKRVLLIDA
ncbi:MAG TPA: tyrosine protein kinase, partial [Achromobacter sp.]|nr:tyrosine protein kinase [Achromobacter sp.]